MYTQTVLMGIAASPPLTQSVPRNPFPIAPCHVISQLYSPEASTCKGSTTLFFTMPSPISNRAVPSHHDTMSLSLSLSPMFSHRSASLLLVYFET